MAQNLLLERAAKYLPSEKLALVSAAYDYASNAHEGAYLG
jgi:(p)ppGpp synthase/HD superfamily hydrolase